MLYIRDDSIEVSKEGIRCFFEIDKVDFKTNDSVNSKFLDIMKQEYLNNLKQSFEITRNQVNTGQKMMEMYINFCKTRENFSPKIFESGRRALRYLGEPSKLKSAETWEKFPSSDDPPAPYTTWDFFELGNFLKWNLGLF